MLQDLSFGTLENAFHNWQPGADDVVICIRDGNILLCRHPDDVLELPCYRAVKEWSAAWNSWGEKPLQYIFRQQNVDYYLWMGQAGDCPEARFGYEPVRTLRQMTSRPLPKPLAGRTSMVVLARSADT